jgi:hypothetical protein
MGGGRAAEAKSVEEMISGYFRYSGIAIAIATTGSQTKPIAIGISRSIVSSARTRTELETPPPPGKKSLLVRTRILNPPSNSD